MNHGSPLSPVLSKQHSPGASNLMQGCIQPVFTALYMPGLTGPGDTKKCKTGLFLLTSVQSSLIYSLSVSPWGYNNKQRPPVPTPMRSVLPLGWLGVEGRHGSSSSPASREALLSRAGDDVCGERGDKQGSLPWAGG